MPNKNTYNENWKIAAARQQFNVRGSIDSTGSRGNEDLRTPGWETLVQGHSLLRQHVVLVCCIVKSVVTHSEPKKNVILRVRNRR